MDFVLLSVTTSAVIILEVDSCFLMAGGGILRTHLRPQHASQPERDALMQRANRILDTFQPEFSKALF